MKQFKSMTESEKKAYGNVKHSDKAKSSFKTKWHLYVFEKYICSSLHDISVDNFRAYQIKPEMVDLYTKWYWQDFDVHGQNGKKIYDSLNNWENEYENKGRKDDIKRDYLNNYENIFSKKDFNALLDQNECHYCHITEEDLNKLFQNKQIRKKNLRGWQLEIDRKDSNFEYAKDNCVLACYWCNNAKTDEFTEEEFIEVGKEIEKIWKQRLAK